MRPNCLTSSHNLATTLAQKHLALLIISVVSQPAPIQPALFYLSYSRHKTRR